MTHPDHPYGHPPYGYGYAPYGSVPAPKHPQATTALVLGIVSVGGGIMCYLPLLCSPFAWVVGRRTLREIQASGGRWSGHSEAKAGYVLGVIGTVLLVVAIAAIVALIVLASTFGGTSHEEFGTTRDTLATLGPFVGR